MDRRRILVALWWLLLVGVFLTPYAQWRYWSFPVSTVLLLALFFGRWRASALDRVGLNLGGRAVAMTLALAIALWALFRFLLVPMVQEDAGLAQATASFGRVAPFPFQALNEEMVLGALVLFPLVDRWRRPVLWSLLLAVVFAALHYALYRFGSAAVSLAPLTLVGLTAVGCVRHAAILLARHVGYAWAMHAAWNVVLFSGAWWLEAEGRRLREPEVFDAFLGAPSLVALASAAAVSLLAALAWKERRASG